MSEIYWERPTRAQLGLLAELRDVLLAVPPSQVGETSWHRTGPVNPPDGTTVMCAANWFARSPLGARLGLSLRIIPYCAVMPKHDGANLQGHEATAHALACSYDDAWYLFSGVSVPIGATRNDPAGDDAALRRVQQILALGGGRRLRVLSSR